MCQVREQERYIAQQLRRQVLERRETQLQILGDALQREWQQERADRLQSLARAYEESLRSVGHAHHSAQENVRRVCMLSSVSCSSPKIKSCTLS